MRSIIKSLTAGAVALAITIGLVAPGEAAFFGLPRVLKSQLDHIGFQAPITGPFPYAHFCMRYAQDCREHGHVFRKPRPVVLTDARRADVAAINRRVNRSIAPHVFAGQHRYDSWRIGPTKGDCADYAVTKRHELLAHGWPSRALLLAEVVTNWGEHHLVLVVRTEKEDLVLDNLQSDIVVWSRAPYQWVRIQSPVASGLVWSTVRPV